ARRDDDVGEEIERGIDLLIEYVRVERRVLLAGERVDVAAEDVDDLGDVAGGAAFRSFENEMLEEVRRAAVLFRLDRGAATQVKAEGHGANVRKRLDENRQAGRQHMPRNRGSQRHCRFIVDGHDVRGMGHEAWEDASRLAGARRRRSLPLMPHAACPMSVYLYGDVRL